MDEEKIVYKVNLLAIVKIYILLICMQLAQEIKKTSLILF